MENNANPAEEPSEFYEPIRRSATDMIPGLPRKALPDFWAWAYSRTGRSRAMLSDSCLPEAWESKPEY